MSDNLLDDRTISILTRDAMASSPDDERLLHMHMIGQLIAAEREACAVVCDQFAKVSAALDGGHETSAIAAGLANAAAAIRARSETSA